MLSMAAIGCQQPMEKDMSNKQSAPVETQANEEADSTVSDRGPEAESKSSDHEEVPEGAGRGRGRMGRGPGLGMGRGPGMREDMTTLHAMFAGRDKITRLVNNFADGAEAITESDDAKTVSLLQEHVPAMEGRVLENDPLPPMTFHPIFVELIKHADDYTLIYDETEKGIRVKYIADDPYVVMLVQEHAKLVSRFIANGMQEIHKPYTLPEFDIKVSGMRNQN